MKLSILAGIAALTCVAATVACGSSSKNGFQGGDGGGSSGGDGGSSGGEGGGGDGGSSGGTTPYVGTVSASKTNSASNPVFGITAEFAANPDAGNATPTCAGTQSGSCCYLPPASGDAGVSDAGTPTITFVSAGAISFTDGTAAIANVSPGTNGAYAIGSGNNPSVKWTPGDTLKVSAAGAMVSAFTANLVTVEDLAGVTPALSSTATTVPITTDLTISWTASTATNVGVLVDAIKGTKGDGTITCVVDDSAGTVTVPAALLGKFSTGDTGIISLTRTSLTKSTEANATVNLVSTVTSGGTAKFQ